MSHSPTHLDLWKKGLGKVPDSVWERTELETLVLADNELREVSPRIGALTKLRMLDLGHNQLTSVPDSLGDLPALTDFLYLHDNRLASLPPGLGRLALLRYLNISQNLFEELPACVQAMTGLLELRAEGNRLAVFPEWRFPRLRELHLRDNRLRSLPSSIGDLAELRQIDLRGNPLEHLPEEVLSLPRLEKLDLRWVKDFPLPSWTGTLESRGCVVYS
jgi:Leucine-rich repeat (LRR) protein